MNRLLIHCLKPNTPLLAVRVRAPNHHKVNFKQKQLKLIPALVYYLFHVISAGVEALSLYGQHFFEQLAELEAQCDRTRQQTLTDTTKDSAS